MKNINDLPDNCLETIFAKLLLRDLLRLHQVCSNWKRIQPSVCSKHKELTILIGILPERLLEYSRFVIPYYDELIPTSPFSTTKILNQNTQLQFDWLDGQTAKSIARLLPNIITITISIRYPNPSICIGEKSWGVRSVLMHQIIHLLRKWSDKAQTLKLYFNFEDKNDDKPIECDLPKLIHTINSFQKLRHLTINLENKFFFEKLNCKLDLSILAKIEEFHLEFQDDYEVIAESLSQYGGENLHSLAICAEAGTLNLYDNKMAEKFTQLPDVVFCEENFAHMKQFCSRFWRLQKLSIDLSGVGKIYEFVEMMPSLKELIYLHIKIEESQGEIEKNQGLITIPQIHSIKIIKIDASLNSHNQLYSIQWEKMFPNLEIFHYNNSHFGCSICNDQEDNVESIKETLSNCLKLALQPWKFCTKLHSIYTGVYSCSNVNKWSLKDLL